MTSSGPPLTPASFPAQGAMMIGGEKLFFPLWTAPFLSLSTSLLTPVDPQGIQCHCHIVYSPLQLPDTSGRVRTRGKAAGAGHLRALEHVSVLPTVDAASPDHLEPPPRASRGPRRPQHDSRAGPSLSLSLSPPAARARCRPARPTPGLARASTRASPRSLSLFLAPYAMPTSAADSPKPPPVATTAISADARRPRPR